MQHTKVLTCRRWGKRLWTSRLPDAGLFQRGCLDPGFLQRPCRAACMGFSHRASGDRRAPE